MMTSDFEPSINEPEIWLQFKEGNQSAYEYLYHTYSALLFRYGCKILSDRDVVKDCLHDLFTEIWRNKANLSNPVSIKNYLVKSLRNKLVREAAKQSKLVSADSVEEAAFSFVNSSEFDHIALETKTSEKKRLVKALRGLTSKQKEVIFLLYYNNLSPAEVATIMSVSIRTIYNTAFSAIQCLRTEMAVVVVCALLSDKI